MGVLNQEQDMDKKGAIIGGVIGGVMVLGFLIWGVFILVSK